MCVCVCVCVCVQGLARVPSGLVTAVVFVLVLSNNEGREGMSCPANQRMLQVYYRCLQSKKGWTAPGNKGSQNWQRTWLTMLLPSGTQARAKRRGNKLVAIACQAVHTSILMY